MLKISSNIKINCLYQFKVYFHVLDTFHTNSPSFLKKFGYFISLTIGILILRWTGIKLFHKVLHWTATNIGSYCIKNFGTFWRVEDMLREHVRFWYFNIFTVQKIKFSIKDLFSKCDQIPRKLRFWSIYWRNP